MAEVQLAAHTNDAHPDEEPYRISDKPGHDVATVTLTLAGQIEDVFRALRVRIGALDRMGGTPARTRGIVCGLGQRCGADARSVALPAGFVEAVQVSYADTGPAADGLVPVSVHALLREEAWA